MALLLLKVENDWLLFNGLVAAEILGFNHKAMLMREALYTWEGGLNDEEFLECLKEILDGGLKNA